MHKHYLDRLIASIPSCCASMEIALWFLTFTSAMAFLFHPFPLLIRNNFLFLFCCILTRCYQLKAIKPANYSENLGSRSPALHGGKKKVVFVMGATGTGKSKLAIDLALLFSGEIINSDKMQVYKGLDVLTNKVTPEEQELVPHHLIGIVGPDAEFTAEDFRRAATAAIDDVAARGKLPVVAGGSNSYIEALVDDPAGEFRSRFESCFLWVDVDMDVLHSFVSDRVDEMVEGGLVEEVRAVYRPDADYTVGVRRAIGVPEMDKYFRATITVGKDDVLESAIRDTITVGNEEALASAISEIKANTCKLACCQLEKIHRLGRKPGWEVRRLAGTAAFRAAGEGKAVAWRSNVAGPASAIVARFVAGCEQGEERLHGAPWADVAPVAAM